MVLLPPLCAINIKKDITLTQNNVCQNICQLLFINYLNITYSPKVAF